MEGVLMNQSAAMPDQGEEKELEVSLYDLLQHYREVVGKPVARLFYAASFKELEKGARTDFINSIANSMKAMKNEGKKVCGFMQVKGNYIIHLLEGESTHLADHIKQLYTDYKHPKSNYERINILAFNEEVPEECFPDWEFDDVFQSGTISTEFDKTEQMLERIWNIYSALLKVGIKLKEKLKRDNKLSKQVWRELTNEASISNEDLSIMIHPGYMSIEDYMEMYEGELDIVLDDELSFPQPNRMSKILEFFDTGVYNP